MEKELPKRKPNRLENFDYSSNGAYFITICTKNRHNYFWNTVGATIGRPQDVPLTKYGKIAMHLKHRCLREILGAEEAVI